ncbi:hypothetical protein PpBr36_06885 [Pyricularia pennisetigena]|uniref:hypothetical protein n=1 Tax=Pyricularia pennisetigena TaxID=1578925 RepID=UPI00114FFA78|nr:hypothetical protein PpBr36_06885 [Pyricularia pennisetigena]TLS26082.1 hypothetical protein PpBr36_06885 [Pyricularia pennisetigena]
MSMWQTPNTFLTQGLSVGQVMGIIVIARLIVSLFSIILGWVCLTAIWPSFQRIHNQLPDNFPATTSKMVGFTVFWVVSVPFLFIRPEHFKKPFFFSSLGCGIGMLAIITWSLSVAGGVGPVFYKGEAVPASSRWSFSWLMMAGLNQAIGQKAAGMYTAGVNWRVLPCWVAGWDPTIGGLIATVSGRGDGPAALYQLYYVAFFVGLAISFVLFYTLNWLFPVKGAGGYDEHDDWATFTPREAEKLGIVPHENAAEFVVPRRFGDSGYRPPRPAPASSKEKNAEVAATQVAAGGQR